MKHKNLYINTSIYTIHTDTGKLSHMETAKQIRGQVIGPLSNNGKGPCKCTCIGRGGLTASSSVLPPPCGLFCPLPMPPLEGIPRPLVTAQEHGAADSNPGNPRHDSPPEGAEPFLPRDASHHIPHPDTSGLAALITSSREHDPRLDHIQRRRQTRGDRTRDATEQRARRRRYLLLTLTTFRTRRQQCTSGIRVLHVLPHGELQDRERDLPRDGDPRAPVQFADHLAVASLRLAGRVGMPQGEDILECEERRAAEETGLGALLDDFCGDPDCARGDLTQRRGQGVRDERLLPCWRRLLRCRYRCRR